MLFGAVEIRGCGLLSLVHFFLNHIYGQSKERDSLRQERSRPETNPSVASCRLERDAVFGKRQRRAMRIKKINPPCSLLTGSWRGPDGVLTVELGSLSVIERVSEEVYETWAHMFNMFKTTRTYVGRLQRNNFYSANCLIEAENECD